MSDLYQQSLERQPEETASGPLSRLLRRRLIDLLSRLRGCEIKLSDAEGDLKLGSISETDRDPIKLSVQVYSTASVAAQRRKSEISGQRNTWYCGAYWGWGFHEDGMRSAVDVARGLGIGWPPTAVEQNERAA